MVSTQRGSDYRTATLGARKQLKQLKAGRGRGGGRGCGLAGGAPGLFGLTKNAAVAGSRGAGGALGLFGLTQNAAVAGSRGAGFPDAGLGAAAGWISPTCGGVSGAVTSMGRSICGEAGGGPSPAAASCARVAQVARKGGRGSRLGGTAGSRAGSGAGSSSADSESESASTAGQGARASSLSLRYWASWASNHSVWNVLRNRP